MTALVVDGMTALVVALVKAEVREATTAAAFAVDEAAVVAGGGRFAAAAIVVALDGKATSEFPDISIQRLFALVRAARRARPSTLAR